MTVTMQWQLVGDGSVVMLTLPGETVTTTVAISAKDFVEAVEKLVQQAKPHPFSYIRRLRVESDR